jgi:hypothetical protein
MYTEDEEPLTERPEWVEALAVYQDAPIDAGRYHNIFYSATDDLLVETDGLVEALLPIDEKTAARLLKLPGVEEIR